MVKPSQKTRNIYYEIARAVRDQESLSRAAVARYLVRSPATIHRAINKLISGNVIYDTGERKNDRVGRPSKLLEFNSRLSSVLSVDLRSTEVYAAITDLAGNILATSIKRLALSDTQSSIQELIEIIHDLLRAAANLPPVTVLVIGAPSIVNAEEGMIEWAPSLDWKNIPLKKILEEEFHITTLIENEANLAALGEFWKGASRKVKNNIIFISVGTGLFCN